MNKSALKTYPEKREVRLNLTCTSFIKMCCLKENVELTRNENERTIRKQGCQHLFVGNLACVAHPCSLRRILFSH